jgi:hypothetical protein
MKYVKIFLVASLTLFGLASCGPKDAGTVGDASVAFYSDNIEGGFAADFLMVPIVLSNAEETTADVTVTVKAKEYTGAFAGEVDKDFMLTTENMVFKPGVDSINVEVMILNKNVDELNFVLEIAETNATKGTVTEVLVSLAKTDLDRLCGEWVTNSPLWTTDKGGMKPLNSTPSTIKIAYDGEYLNILNFWSGETIYAYYDEGFFYMLPFEPLYYYDSSAGQLIYQMWCVPSGDASTLITPYDDYVIGTWDETFSNITWSPDPETQDIYLGAVVFTGDSNFNPIPGTYLGRITGLMKNDGLSRPSAASVQAIPGKAAMKAPMTNKIDEIKYHLTDYQRVKVLEALNSDYTLYE